MSGTTDDFTGGNYPNERDQLLGLIKASNRTQDKTTKLWQQQAKSLNRFSQTLEDFSTSQIGRRAAPRTAAIDITPGAQAKSVFSDFTKSENYLSSISKETKKQTNLLDGIQQLLSNTKIAQTPQDSKAGLTDAPTKSVNLLASLDTNIKSLLQTIKNKDFGGSGEGGGGGGGGLGDILKKYGGSAAAALGGVAGAGVAGGAAVIATTLAAHKGLTIQQKLDSDALKHGFKPTAEPGGFEGSTMQYKNDQGQVFSPSEMQDYITKTPEPAAQPITTPNISPEGKGLLDTIGKGESGGSYTVRQGGKENISDYSQHPGTVAAGGVSTATGKYQFIKSTWDEASKAVGAKDFSPENQDKAAWWLAQRDYNKRTGGNLSEDVKSKDPKVQANIATALNKTWTSLPGGGDATQQGGRKQSEYLANLAANTDKYQKSEQTQVAQATPLTPAAPATPVQIASATTTPPATPTPQQTTQVGPPLINPAPQTTIPAPQQIAQNISPTTVQPTPTAAPVRTVSTTASLLPGQSKERPTAASYAVGKDIDLDKMAAEAPKPTAPPLIVPAPTAAPTQVASATTTAAGLNKPLIQTAIDRQEKEAASYKAGKDVDFDKMAQDLVAAQPPTSSTQIAAVTPPVISPTPAPTINLAPSTLLPGQSPERPTAASYAAGKDVDLDTPRANAVQPAHYLPPETPAAPAAAPEQTAAAAPPAGGSGNSSDKSPDINAIPMVIGDNGIIYVNHGGLA